jgi:hypothetical protein
VGVGVVMIDITFFLVAVLRVFFLLLFRGWAEYCWTD